MFETSTKSQAPQAAILYDKFRVTRYLGEALDAIRKSGYARLSGTERKFIKGQKYNLLSRREHLSLKGKQALALLLKANKRINAAYILKEIFAQLWDYCYKACDRKFFDNWKASLKGQRLKPYDDFADMIERIGMVSLLTVNQRTRFRWGSLRD